jgi:Uma2 family endonuclease
MNLAIKLDEHYTYADYLTWDTGDRYELIGGAPYLMSPAPSTMHQRVAAEMFNQIYTWLRGKPCEALFAPVDVRLNPDDTDDTVVQPDIIVVCDKNKIEKKAVKGAPDLVIEVISPSTRNYDSVLKLGCYMKAGVRECWLVDTENYYVRVYVNNGDGTETLSVHNWDAEAIPVNVIDGLTVNMRLVPRE